MSSAGHLWVSPDRRCPDCQRILAWRTAHPEISDIPHSDRILVAIQSEQMPRYKRRHVTHVPRREQLCIANADAKAGDDDNSRADN